MRVSILVVLAAFLGSDAAPAPAPPAPRWFKGNTHTHTLWSDGNDFPEMVVDWYRKQGYQFLVLSDHNVVLRGQRWMQTQVVEKRAPGRGALARYQKRFGADWVELRERGGQQQVRLKPLAEFRPRFEKPGEFLLIEGEEITDSFKRKPIHINALNLEELIKPRKGKSIRDTMRNNLRAVQAQAAKAGKTIIAHLNHPNYGWGVTAEDLAYVLEDRFFEVYNGHPGVRHTGDALHASVERMWDVVNTIRVGILKAKPMLAVATDDSHHYHGRGTVTSGRGWIQVRSRSLAPDAIMEAMNRGDFYASSGVTLSDLRYDAEARTLTVAIDSKPNVTYEIRFSGTRRDWDRASYPIVNVNGVELHATRRYSKDVGALFATVRGDRASYQLKGDELYVRATVVSSRPHPNASFKGQVEEAWTQPVGWEKAVR
ncbi:MAG: hypothetical protein CMJ18_15500 [Phycisphaeraceae bacterium]|nr:hypothetical protein [Phycisphaeraceae bacterium]